MRYRKQRRGGKGLRDIRTSDRNGPVVAVKAVRDTDDIMLINLSGRGDKDMGTAIEWFGLGEAQ